MTEVDKNESFGLPGSSGGKHARIINAAELYPDVEFIRRGTTNPKVYDYADLLVRRRYFDHEGSSEKLLSQGRLKTLYDTYYDNDALIGLNDGSIEISSTPLLWREYFANGEKFDVGIGVGRPKDSDDDLELVMSIEEGSKVLLMPLPDNGVEGVPATHGVNELLDWMESLYPKVHKVAQDLDSSI